MTVFSGVMFGNIQPVNAGGDIEQAITIKVDGNIIMCSDAMPFKHPEYGRVYVGLRAISNCLGATDPEWDGNTQTVTIVKDGRVVKMTVGKYHMIVDGVSVPVDAPAINVGGRIMVPIRCIAEAFAVKVGWDQAASTVNIYVDTQAPPEPIKPVQSTPAWMNDSSLSPQFKKVLSAFPGTLEKDLSNPDFTCSMGSYYCAFEESVESNCIAIFIAKTDSGYRGYIMSPEMVDAVSTAIKPLVGDNAYNIVNDIGNKTFVKAYAWTGSANGCKVTLQATPAQKSIRIFY